MKTRRALIPIIAILSILSPQVIRSEDPDPIIPADPPDPTAAETERAKVLHKRFETMALDGPDHLGVLKLASRHMYERYRLKPFGIGEAPRARRNRRGRRGDVDLFALLSGGLAIRESLQTDTIRPLNLSGDAVPLAELSGPRTRSHPFKEMLGKRPYKVFPLANYAPADFYYLHFRSTKKALHFFDYLDEVGGSMYQRFAPSAVNFNLREGILRQLAIKLDPANRPFYDLVLDSMAIVGSDPFVRTGSDVTIIYKLKRPAIFKSKIASYRKHFRERFKTMTVRLKIDGIDCELLRARHRRVHSYYLTLPDGTPVISNSRAALERVVAVYRKKAKSLANLDEYKYMRSVYPADPKSEDVFLYLSDAFIRRLTGPEVRIKEAMRMHEARRLATMEKYSLLFRMIRGRGVRDMDDLRKEFPASVVESFTGLTPDSGSEAAVSTKYGRMGSMVPNIDTPMTTVPAGMAKRYRRFVREYENYWRDYFDPIGIRVKFGKTVRIETCILPLINNSIYRGLTNMFGGAPVELSSGGTAMAGEVLSLNLKLNRELFHNRSVRKFEHEYLLTEQERKQAKTAGGKYRSVIADILGDEIQFHMMDRQPLVDFDGGILAREMTRSRPRMSKALWGVLAWSLFHPIRVTVPLKKSKRVERVMDLIPSMINQTIGNDRWLRVTDYKLHDKKQKFNVVRVSLFRLIKFRIYYAIHDKALHVTTTREYMGRILNGGLDKAIASRCLFPGLFGSKNERRGAISSSPSRGNARAVYRPHEMRKERDLYIANIMETSRDVSVRNFSTYALLRSVYGPRQMAEKSMESFGFRLQCPAGGKYSVDKNGKVSNSVFGSPVRPKIDLLKADAASLKRFFSTKEIKVNLEFTKEGIKTLIAVK